MSFQVIPYFDSPRLHDRVIQKIRSRFDTYIDWLDYSFPLVQVGVVNTEEGDVTFPMVYANDGSTTHYDIRPDWDEGAYCFFEMEEPPLIIDFDDGTEYTFAVVFYARLDKAYPAKSNYDYTSELIAEVIDHLKHVTINAHVLSWDVRPENIFDKYSDLERSITQHLMKQGTAFKITFTVHDVEDCYNEVS